MACFRDLSPTTNRQKPSHPQPPTIPKRPFPARLGPILRSPACRSRPARLANSCGTPTPAADARGNLAFADGHVDFAPRRVAQHPRVFAPQLTYLADYAWAE